MEDILWELLIQMQGQEFSTAKGMVFTYSIHGHGLYVDRKQTPISRSSVFVAYRKALACPEAIQGPKSLGVYGASYIFPLFLALFVIQN